MHAVGVMVGVAPPIESVTSIMSLMRQSQAAALALAVTLSLQSSVQAGRQIL
eukprot:SAG22_NODE_2102_length_3010_cov_2.033322_3_plen_52_part_00